MNKENLPEEKLLKLIRGKKPDRPAAAAKPLKASQLKTVEVKYFFGFLNILLIVAAAGLAGFLVYRGIFLAREEKNRFAETAPLKENKDVEAAAVILEKPPLQYYKEQFAKRDLFERPLDQVAVSATADLTKRYKLVGIVLGKVPEAIIEDLSTHSTVFVHEGEMLDTVQIRKIEEGRVVFLQEGLEVELKQ